MALYNSSVVWRDLAETGRCHMGDYDELEIELLREHLHEEAREEGVQLRINADKIRDFNHVRSVHVYLRKRR